MLKAIANYDYQPVSLQRLLKKGPTRYSALVIGSWLLSLLLSIGLGLASIIFEWSGIPATIGGVDIYITIYPPLVFCLFWTLWFGFWWGFIPAYLSTLVLALYSGMPMEWSLLFAFADPIGLAVFAIAYRAIPVSFTLRSVNSVLVFVALSFVSGIFSSSGSFIWTHTNGIGISEIFPVWQGWWLGAFFQNILLVAPLLALFGPAAINWRNKNNWGDGGGAYQQKHIILMTITMLVGVFIYIYLSVQLSAGQLESAFLGSASNDWQVPVNRMTESVSALYWVVSTIIIFVTLFGYRLFHFWASSMEQSRQALRIAHDGLEERVKQRTRELKEAKDHAEQANAAKSQFLTNTSHELRTPLNAVLGFGQLLEMDTDPRLSPKHLEHVQDILRAGEHLLHIINQLLDLSKIESGHSNITLEKTHLGNVLQQCIGFITPLASSRHIKFLGDTNPGSQCMVTADPIRLKQVLINLLSNAVKYNQAQGHITILCSRDDNTVQLTISNTGPGISAVNLERIFDLFNRGEAHSEIEGSGIGLAVTRNLVDLMHGELRVQSTPNDLTTFTLSLPTA